MTTRFDKVVSSLRLEWIRDRSEADESTIQAFESSLGQKLPEDYREFLRVYGMTFASNVIFPSGGGVEVFYGLQAEGGYNLKREWEGMRNHIPPNFLPIADSPGGVICMSLAAHELGAIYWYASSQYRQTHSGLVYIAPSFTRFMNSLSIDDEG